MGMLRDDSVAVQVQLDHHHSFSHIEDAPRHPRKHQVGVDTLVGYQHAGCSVAYRAASACACRYASYDARTVSYFSARISTAKSAAFLAPHDPIAIEATGTPGGIWTIA